VARTIAFLGPAGTYSEQALKQYDQSATGLPVRSERDAIHAVASGKAQRAIVPVENAIGGPVTATVDTLASEPLAITIVAELLLPISLCLIAAEQPLAAIETVISHPQPLLQCAGFLAEELPQATQVAAASSADAVRAVSEQGGARAAIGGRIAAELYNMPVLVDGIEDRPGNVTRFVILAAAGTPADPGTGPLKTTVVLKGADDTAAVIDLEGGVSDPHVSAAIERLGNEYEDVRMLGSYPAA
jgi:prephenate dehydratase